MAQNSFSLLLLLRRLASKDPKLHRAKGPVFLSHILTPRHYSSLPSLQTKDPTTFPSPDPKPTSLSARMSFVFDQIDAIEKERSQKDDTLQRIRAWRESKRNRNNEGSSNLGLGVGEVNSSGLDSGESEKKGESEGLMSKEVELVHPWPEWIELMERLVQQNYFDHRRKDEDKMVQDLGFEMSEIAEEGFDFTRDWKTVQTACLNFGKDRFDILRSLSRQDIQLLVGYGCPSADKKVVFSSKLLRKHVHMDEGDVCSSCSLRSSCERAYLLTNKEDEARTIDIMRVLLTYGFDPLNGSVVNESLLKRKSVKTVVRKLLHEVVKLSAVPIDPNLPPPIIKKPPPKVKQPPPPPRKRVGRDDIEMKKGDWLCQKCDFMNFAKNLVCLQCDAKRPKRQLLPGEWECPQCNFLNYRRNMACFHCEHKRPHDDFMENQNQERHPGLRTSSGKIPSRAEISNAWNFDFDDDESDGADVAAFEYADSQRRGEHFPQDGHDHGENLKGPEDGLYRSGKTPRPNTQEYSDASPRNRGVGFNDFDDEEDDNVDSYELDTRNNNPGQKSSSIDFSEVEGYSDSEDIEGFDDNELAPRGRGSQLRGKPSKSIHQRTAFSGSEDNELDFDSDGELPVQPNRRSSHVADFRARPRGRGAMNVGSDEELGFGSGAEDLAEEDFGSRKNKGSRRDSNRRDFRRRGSSDIEDDDSDLESDDEDMRTQKGRSSMRGRKVGPSRGGNTYRGRGDFDFDGDLRFRSDMDDRRKSFGDRSSKGSRGGHRGSQRDSYGGHKVNDRGGDFRKSKGRKQEGFGNRQHGRHSDFGNRSEMGGDFDDERYRRPRVNVR